jgi:hypothetical protein
MRCVEPGRSLEEPREKPGRSLGSLKSQLEGRVRLLKFITGDSRPGVTQSIAQPQSF